MDLSSLNSPETYLTGRTALNVPEDEVLSGDWHCATAILDPAARIHTAGERGTLVNTNPILGTYGVRDCSRVLALLGVPVSGAVYAANHVRAILDLALRSVMNQHRFPLHLETEKWLETKEQWRELEQVSFQIQPLLPTAEREIFRGWVQQTLAAAD